MSPKYPLLPSSVIVSALKRAGFHSVRTKGSHHKMKNLTGRTVIVPLHDEVAQGTLKSILEQAGMELEQFLIYVN